MPKYSFLDDYSEGCHPRILDALVSTNMTQQTAYGADDFSIEAKRLIGQHLGGKDAGIYLVASGTLANLISIASCLRPHEAVIAPASGHIAQREAGAIEATGHKIITVPATDGKLFPEDVRQALAANAQGPHMVKPRMVYISNATEFGTIYTKAELVALSSVCIQHDLLLFMDGARLGTALAAPGNDLDLAEIAQLTDMFWIGGTKAGALIGEAIVITNDELNRDFEFHLKQRGAMLAKGRMLGIQFQELFSDDLIFEVSRHANAMAQKLSTAVLERGFELAAQTESNQVFPLLPDPVITSLSESFSFYTWEKRDAQHSVIRLVTSWATHEAQVDAFIEALS